MGIDDNSRVIIVYYDFAESRLRLMYSNKTVDASDPDDTDLTFVENEALKLPDYVGQYVSMTVVDNHIHIAAFDANDSDLKYIYIDAYNSNTYDEMTVDASGSVGNWTNIRIDTTSDHPYSNKPVIAYYNATETGGREPIKLAIANATTGNVEAGVDSLTGYTKDGWEYMTVPAITPPQGGSAKFRHVCLDFDSDGLPVVGYLGTYLEFGKEYPEE